MKPVKYVAAESCIPQLSAPVERAEKSLVGVDVFLDWPTGTPDELGAALSRIGNENLKLAMITNRGVKVWPGGAPETFCTDHWRCRFLPSEGAGATHGHIVSLLDRVAHAGLDFIKTEHLYNFDGQPGYSLGQGQ